MAQVMKQVYFKGKNNETNVESFKEKSNEMYFAQWKGTSNGTMLF